MLVMAGQRSQPIRIVVNIKGKRLHRDGRALNSLHWLKTRKTTFMVPFFDVIVVMVVNVIECCVNVTS